MGCLSFWAASALLCGLLSPTAIARPLPNSVDSKLLTTSSIPHPNQSSSSSASPIFVLDFSRSEENGQASTINIADLNVAYCESFRFILAAQLPVDTDGGCQATTSPPVPWLTFNATSVEWSGIVPKDTQPGRLNTTLTILSTSFNTSVLVTFNITVGVNDSDCSSRPSTGGLAVPTMAPVNVRSSNISVTAVVLLALLVPIGCAILYAIIWSCFYRKKKDRGRSQPTINAEEDDQSISVHERPSDEEMAQPRPADPPPRLPLPKRLSGLLRSVPELQYSEHTSRPTVLDSEGTKASYLKGPSAKPDSNEVHNPQSQGSISPALRSAPIRPARPSGMVMEDLLYPARPPTESKPAGASTEAPHRGSASKGSRRHLGQGERLGRTASHHGMRNGRVSALGTNESSPVSSSEEWTDGSTVPEVSSHAAGFQHQPWTVRVVNSPDPSAPPTESGAQYRCSRGLPSPWFGGSRAAARERAWRRNAESAAEAIPAPPSPAFENPGDLVAGKATTEARTAKSNAANDPRPASVEAPGMLRTFGTLLSANLNRASWRLSMASNRSGEAFSLASSQDPISRPKRPPPADENAAQNRIPISNRGGDGPEIRFQINNRDSILSTFSEGEAGVIETATTAQRPMSSLSPGSAISCPSRPATPRIVDVRAKHPFSVAADKRAISHTGSLASGFRSEDGQAEMSSASHMAFL